jgi:hypothetical protein
VTPDPTVTAAAIAALVATGGYLLTQRASRRVRKSQVYAEALRALRDLEALPYTIWRRGDDSPEAVRQIGALQSDRFAAAHYYSQLLRIETPWVGRIYHHLQFRVRRQTSHNAKAAWLDGPRLNTGRLWAGPSFINDTGPELDLCLAAMQADVGWSGRFRRRALRRRLAALAAARPILPVPDPGPGSGP